MRLTAIQPRYYSGDEPDAAIAEFLVSQLKSLETGSLTLLPEYSNCGGLSEPERELAALPRAAAMRRESSDAARKFGAYVAVNVLEERAGRLYNSTILYNREGSEVFVYDKIHLPPSEVELGITHGSGECFV